MNTFFGIVIGALLVGAGYIVYTKQTFFFLAGFQHMWQPVNEKRLGKRVGALIMLLGFVAICTAIATLFVGHIAGDVSAIIALITVMLIIGAIIVDRLGY